MSASLLNDLGGLITGMSLSKRIQEVMGEMAPGEFAKACEVTPASVTFWVSGDTKTLRAEPVAHMEAKFGYRASWIVTGKGPKKLDDRVDVSWRLSEDLRQKVLPLSDEELLRIEKLLRAHLDLPLEIPSADTNRLQVVSGKTRQDAHTDLTEDDAGPIEGELPREQPASRKHARHKDRGPTHQKGGGRT